MDLLLIQGCGGTCMRGIGGRFPNVWAVCNHPDVLISTGNFAKFMGVMKKATFKDVAPEKYFVEFQNTVAKVSQCD